MGVEDPLCRNKSGGPSPSRARSKAVSGAGEVLGAQNAPWDFLFNLFETAIGANNPRGTVLCFNGFLSQINGFKYGHLTIIYIYYLQALFRRRAERLWSSRLHRLAAFTTVVSSTPPHPLTPSVSTDQAQPS